MYSKLGDIEFGGLLGMSSFEQKDEMNYVEHHLVEGKPTLQKVGEVLSHVRFDMLLSAQFCTVEDEIKKLQDKRKASEVLKLTLGTGEFVGNFVIKSITKKISQAGADGLLVLATLEVELLEFVSKIVDEAPTGIAMSGAPEINYVELTQNESSKMLEIQTVALGQMQLATASIAKMTPAAKLASLFKSADVALKKAQEALARAKAALQAAKHIIQSAEKIKKAIEDSVKNAQNARDAIVRAKKAIADGDVEGLKTALDETMSASDSMKASGSRLRYANSETALLATTRKSTFV